MDTSLRNSVNPLSSYFSLSYCESLLLLRMKKGRKKKSRKMEGGGRRQRKVLNVPGTSYTLSQLILTLYNNPIKQVVFIPILHIRKLRLREINNSCIYLDLTLGLTAPGIIPQPRYVPQPGIKPTTFWYTRGCSNELSNLARAKNHIFYD